MLHINRTKSISDNKSAQSEKLRGIDTSLNLTQKKVLGKESKARYQWSVQH